MSKIVTLRLENNEYQEILHAAKIEHRPISNFITTATLKQIEESFYTDNIEMEQIKSDIQLLNKIKKGHCDVKTMKGKFVE